MLDFIQISGSQMNISYTAGDTFKIVIAPEEELPEATNLRLQISSNGTNSGKLIEKSYTISGGEFAVELTSNEIALLSAGTEYCYRLTLFTVTGEIITTMSGDLIVKWGA